MGIEDLLELLGKNTLTTEGKFEDVLVAQLGKIGQIAIDLEAIAKAGKEDEAQRLAKQLDKAQKDGDGELFKSLVLQVEILVAEVRGL